MSAHKSRHATGGADPLTPSDIGALGASNNLSDLGSSSTARSNLGAAATSHSHAASDITSGTVAPARLGSGAASSSTFLRGDQTYAVPPGTTDHGALTGLSDDDHSQYFVSDGRSGGQHIIGGTASGNGLQIRSTSHATKGAISFGNAASIGVMDETNGCVILGYSSVLHTCAILDLNSGTQGFLLPRMSTPPSFPIESLLYYDTDDKKLKIHDGSTWTNVNKSDPHTYTISNATTDRSYDANATTVDELADVLYTLISDLTNAGILGA